MSSRLASGEEEGVLTRKKRSCLYGFETSIRLSSKMRNVVGTWNTAYGVTGKLLMVAQSMRMSEGTKMLVHCTPIGIRMLMLEHSLFHTT